MVRKCCFTFIYFFLTLRPKKKWENVEMTINTRFLTSFLWLRPKKLVRNDKITLYQLPVDTVFENDGVLARRVPGTSPQPLSIRRG